MINRVAYNKHQCKNNLRQPPLFDLIRKDDLRRIELTLNLVLSSTEDLVKLVNEPRICDGYTPLHCAVEHNKPYITLLLICLGADPDIKAKNGKSATDLCFILPERNKNIVTIIHSKDSEEIFFSIVGIIYSLTQKFGKKDVIELNEAEEDFISNNGTNSFNLYFDIDDIGSYDYSSIIAVHRMLNDYAQAPHFSLEKNSLLFNKLNQLDFTSPIEPDIENYDQELEDLNDVEQGGGLNLIDHICAEEICSDEEYLI